MLVHQRVIGKSSRISHVNGCLKSFDDLRWDRPGFLMGSPQDGQVPLWDVQDERFPVFHHGFQFSTKRNSSSTMHPSAEEVFDGVFFFHFWRLTTFLEFLPDQWSIHIDTNHQRLVWFPRYAVPSPHLILFSICIHWYLYSLYIFQWFCHWLDFSIFPSDIGRDSKRFDPPQATGKGHFFGKTTGTGQFWKPPRSKQGRIVTMGLTV